MLSAWCVRPRPPSIHCPPIPPLVSLVIETDRFPIRRLPSQPQFSIQGFPCQAIVTRRKRLSCAMLAAFCLDVA